MPRVLRIINRFNLGGPTYNATFLTKFVDKKYETLLIGGLPEEGETDSLHILAQYGVEPFIIEELQRNPSLKSDFNAYKRIVKIIKEYKPDIVHTHASKAGALGRLAAFRCGVPIVIHTYHGHVFHSYFGKFKTSIFKTIERILAFKTSKIIAISDLQKNEISNIHKIAKEEKFEVIPLGFDLDIFHNDLSVKREITRKKYQLNEEVAIAIIGRVTAIKNHAFFLDVVDDVLSKTTKKVKVFIVGDGDLMNEVIQKSNYINQKHENQIILTSWIKDIATFNAGMDLICLTSDNEGTPVSLIEAQACNVPVVSTNVGGVKDIIDEGKTGYIIEKGNISDYVNKLLDLIENDDKRKEMSLSGWDFVKNKYHYVRLANDVSKLYDGLSLKYLKN